MPPIPLIIVGGFLGAGKTTLVAQAAQRLSARGMRVGLITNDQAANLVDTALLRSAGADVCEVAGGCFCCRFDEMLSALERLMQEHTPDVILGEPVGSCTDLSATVLQPLKDLQRERFRAAPFSVLVDVKQVRTLERLRSELASRDAAAFPDEVMYIYQKQLEEADVIVLNKADLVPPEELAAVERMLREHFTQAPVIVTSARGGEGIDAWLDFVLGRQSAGGTILEIDYDRYAAGEAALGWLNAVVELHSDGDLQWERFCLDLIGGVQSECRALSAQIAHLKLYLSALGSALAANLTSTEGTASLHGSLEGAPRHVQLLVNARVRIDPQTLRTLVERQLQAVCPAAVQFTIIDLQSFAPARPEPTHRYGSVV